MTAGGRPTAGPLDTPRPAPAPSPDQPPAPAPVAPTAAPPGPPDPTPAGKGGPGTRPPTAPVPTTPAGPDVPDQPRPAGAHGPDQPRPAGAHDPDQPRPAGAHDPDQPRPAGAHDPDQPSPAGAGRSARRNGPVRVLVVVGAVLAVAAGVAAVSTRHADSPAPVRTAAAPAASSVPAPVFVTPAPRPAVPARPLAVSIPAIGLTSSLLPLHLDAAGALVPPPDFVHAGWYTGGPAPGDQGPAVIAGHVDSRKGPAVFFRLRDLAPGDLVTVSRSDGRTARFRVTQVERYPKNAFPRLKVYQPTPDPTLRLITCGGSFDYAKRSYRDNIVVYAVSA
jgi:Sortase domain